MTIQLVSVDIRVQTTQGPAGYATRFGPGLNVLNAENSWGKSTLLQSVVFALGLEGALTTSRRSPLGPALTQAVDTASGRASVVESAIVLTIRNSVGRFMRVQRWGYSLEIDTRIVRVWTAPTEAELDSAASTDAYLRDPGAATHELGFHHILEHFIGWDLPLVPNFDRGETRLYLEVLLPLFYVEQKFGWAGVAPRVPTHYRIREPLSRAMEYTLGLHTLDRLRRREALREEESAIGQDWIRQAARLTEASDASRGRLSLLDERPVSSDALRRPLLSIAVDGDWVTSEEGLRRLEARQQVIQQPPTAGERSIQATADLAAQEGRVAEFGAELRRLQEALVVLEADRDVLDSRLVAVDADRIRFRDLAKIQSYGGSFDLELLTDVTCPTCHQDLDGRRVATGTVATPDENLRKLEAERRTLLNLRATAHERLQAMQAQVRSAESELADARTRVRALRDELVSASATPSIALVQERIQLDAEMARVRRALDVLDEVHTRFEELAERLDDVRLRRQRLESEPEVQSDEVAVSRFQSSFREQLASYDLKSVDPSDVGIDARTFHPVTDGFELSFDIALGFSASDSIRTKWAYHTALLETASAATSTSHPLGILILDEPRQQETDRRSLRSFLQRLHQNRERAQIIYATSEARAELDLLLEGVEYTRIDGTGTHLITLRDRVL